MRYKVLALAVLAAIINSCASKTAVVTTTEVKKEEVKFAKAITPELAEGKSLYENNCAKCHSLYKANDFNAEQWKPIVLRMQKKAKLDDVQGQKIYNYLTMQ